MSLDEEAKLHKRSYDSSPKLDYTPSNIFHLEIKDFWISSVPHLWSDTRAKPLERQLESFVRGLHLAAAAKRARLEEKAREENEWAERQRRRDEETKRQQAEQFRVDSLTRLAADWRAANAIRDYLGAVRRDAERRSLFIEPESELNDWLNWATEVADRLDPVPAAFKELSAQRRHAP
jgi:hypothetical protein